MDTQGDKSLLDAWAEMRRKLSSHSARVQLYITGRQHGERSKQGKGSYLLLSMKKDQANKTNVERVYRWQPLAWEPGPNGSGIDLQLVREWAQHSWSGVEAEEADEVRGS